MAITSFKSFLMSSTDGKAYTKLVDIKEFPDLGKAPDTIDITTLSDPMKLYLQDILDTGQLEFTCNYDLDDYKKLQALKGTETKFAIWLGGTESAGVVTPTGECGKFEFSGELAVWVKGAGVSAAVEMGVAIAPSTPISLATA